MNFETEEKDASEDIFFI